jgi:hypothetical protein
MTMDALVQRKLLLLPGFEPRPSLYPTELSSVLDAKLGSRTSSWGPSALSGRPESGAGAVLAVPQRITAVAVISI